MQIISSLLNLQSSYLNEDQTLDILNESQGRIKVMAIAHEKLYQIKNLSNIEFAEYIKSLILQIESTYHDNDSIINTKIDVQDVYLDINTQFPAD